MIRLSAAVAIALVAGTAHAGIITLGDPLITATNGVQFGQTGTLIINGGDTYTVAGVGAGLNPGDAYEIFVTDPGSRLVLNGADQSNRLEAGNRGTGAIYVLNGAVIDGTPNRAACAAGWCNSFIGNAAGSAGELTIMGAGSRVDLINTFGVAQTVVSTNNGLDFGIPGATTRGVVNVLDGGVLNTERAFVGHAPTGPNSPNGLEHAEGTVVVSGNGSQWNVGPINGIAQLLLGNLANGSGSVSVRDGAELNLTATRNTLLTVGSQGGTGTLTIDDATVTLAPPADGVGLVQIGQQGSVGTMSLDNGALFSLGGNATTATGIGVGNTTGTTPGTIGILSLNNGSRVQALGAQSNLVLGSAPNTTTTAIATVRNGSSIEVGNTALVGPYGTMIVNDTSTVEAGTAIVANGGLIGGTGTLIAPIVTAINGGTIAAGTSPGTMTVRGNVEFGLGGILSVEAASASLFDVLNVLGDVSFLTGSSIRFDFLNGFLPGADFGMNFLSATGSITGLGLATYDFRGLPEGFNFAVSSGEGGLRVTRVPEPGTLALLLGALPILAAVRRRRSHSVN